MMGRGMKSQSGVVRRRLEQYCKYNFKMSAISLVIYIVCRPYVEIFCISLRDRPDATYITFKIVRCTEAKKNARKDSLPMFAYSKKLKLRTPLLEHEEVWYKTGHEFGVLTFIQVYKCHIAKPRSHGHDRCRVIITEALDVRDFCLQVSFENSSHIPQF